MNVGARSVTQSNAATDSNLSGHARAPKNSPLLCVNVSGGVFYIHTSDLALHPDSLLAQPEKLEQHFEHTLNSYFFDRNRHVFEYIATFYQTGKLSFPGELDKALVVRELEYFGLQPVEVENIAKVEKVVTMRKTLKSRIHLFLADPSSSNYAAAWAAMDIAFIMISIICFILETEPGYQEAFQNPGHSWFLMLQWVEMVVAVFFTIDFVMRGCTWPSFRKFLSSSQNIIDLLSLLPFYAQLFLSQYMILNFGKILRVLRIFRVIKLFKYFADIFLIIAFVCNAWQEIILIAMLTGILLILFGSLIYFAEYDPQSKIREHPPVYSIMQGLWWSMVTITTVGYGDVCPETLTGRFFGSILVIISMVVLTLPMTVVISKFNRAYEHESRQTERLVLLDGPPEREQTSPRGSRKGGPDQLLKIPTASHYPHNCSQAHVAKPSPNTLKVTSNTIRLLSSNGSRQNSDEQCSQKKITSDCTERNPCELDSTLSSAVSNCHCICKCHDTPSGKYLTLLKTDGNGKCELDLKQKDQF